MSHPHLLIGLLIAGAIMCLTPAVYILCLLAKDAWRDHRSTRRFKRHLAERRNNGKLY